MGELERQRIYDELAAASVAFDQLIAGMTPADLERRTVGTRWTNREMLFHVLLGYFVTCALIPLVKFFGHLPRPASKAFAAFLNVGSWPFHWVNYFGSWMGGHMSLAWMQRRFSRVTRRLARQLGRESEQSLAQGMCFPSRWDPFFRPYLTLREVYHYPTQHFEFHVRQLAVHKP